MQKLKKIILEGWNNQKSKIYVDIRQYLTFNDELTVCENLIFKGMQVVIPRSIRITIMKKLHVTPQGIRSTIKRAREIVFWPGMSRDLQ